MKLRRIFAALAACAIAATSVISASAANTVTIKSNPDINAAGTDFGKPDPSDSHIDPTYGSACFYLKDFGVDTSKIDVKNIAKIQVTIQVDSANANGCIGGNVGGNWASKSWTNSDTEAHVQEWAPDGEFSDIESLQIQIYWIDPVKDETKTPTKQGTVTMSDLKLLDKDGKDLLAAAGGTTNNNTNNNSSNNNNGDKKDNSNKPTGASAGLALAGLALAGVAVVATKKSK